MRKIIAPVSLVLLAGITPAQTNSANRAATPAAPMTPETFKWSELRKVIVTPGSLGRNAIGAGLAQWSDSPEEWEQGMSGYGKRFGSRVGQRAIRGSTHYGLALALHHSRKYQPSGRQGTWTRLKYAIIHTWWIPKTDGSGDTIAYARLGGIWTGAAVSRAWMPESHRTVGRTLTNGFGNMGWDTGTSILREFWPWKKFKP
jgi:hypothetical protein